MTSTINIPFSDLLFDQDYPILYRTCTESLAWRTSIPKTGSASHKDLDSAIFGGKGALTLFGNSSFAQKRREQYGSPRFVAVWLEGLPWALLIQGRVASIIPQSVIAHLDELYGKRDVSELPQIVDKVTRELAEIFDNAESNVLLDPDKKLESWTGSLAIREGMSSLDKKLLEIAELLESQAAFSIIDIEDAREKILCEVVRRRGQPKFREALMYSYNSTCAVSGCDSPEALEAAHIYPYRGEQTNDVSNGLLLRADLHTLFDLGILTIDPESMTARFSSELQLSHYKPLHGVKLRLPENGTEHPSKEALEWHRKTFCSQ